MNDVKKQLLNNIDSEVQKSPDFYLQLGQEALLEWENYSISPQLLESLINMDYPQFINQAQSNDEIGRIKESIFRLVAYCDAKANGKKDLNQYPENRVVAKVGIRQNAWVRQLLKYKLSSNSITDAIKNAFNYLKDPAENFPILSENHRKMISSFLWNKDYQPDTFQRDLLNYFMAMDIDCLNSQNRTYLYTKMIYGISSAWKESKILGLITRDSTEWKNEFLADFDEKGYGVIWKDCLPTSRDKVLGPLRDRLIDEDAFWFYFVANNKTQYRARVIDFATKDNYQDVCELWREKDPLWFNYKFEDYCTDDKKQQAKITFLCDKFEKIEAEEQLDISHFKTIGTPTIKNPVAYTHIMLPKEKSMENKVNQLKQLLQVNKNIILEGAPGTGKTYNTASLAVSMIEQVANFCNHREIMERYEALVASGHINFVTFHQSYDYEDFVEGIKPELINDNVVYKVNPGIFRKICEKAQHDPEQKPYVLIIDEINRGNISKIFGELITLIEPDKRLGALHPIRVKLPYSHSDGQFGVPSNLYLIGTMNTTDRSTGTLDYALRRRFAFVTMISDKSVIEAYYESNQSLKSIAVELFNQIEDFLKKSEADIDINELMVGHSYFLAEDKEELKMKFEYKIIPLIKEYFKDGILNISDDELKEAIATWRIIIQ